MDSRLKDRIAIITGASSGLGKATAHLFARHGARIICADLDAGTTVDEITSHHGPSSATFQKCDVTSEPDIQALITAAVAWGGSDRLDILCNYAGIGLESKYPTGVRAHAFETSHFDREMAVNCRGVWLCCKYALRQMLAQEPREANARGERTRGCIVNAASMLGTVAHPGLPAYVPSKFAVVGMTKQMALDYASDRIHINCVAPGFVESPMIAGITSQPELKTAIEARHPWGSLGKDSNVADAALFLASDEASWVTGHTLVVDGGYTCQ
ncbi:hypothetical protein MBLNU230_g3749t1 [Neophaeotheca triangularis]